MALSKKEQRLRRARQTRARIALQGAVRLTVTRSNLHIYASVISGDGSKVIATASTVEKEVREQVKNGGNAAAAALIGKRIAEKAKALASRRSHSTALASNTTVASRPWLKPRVKPACSSKPRRQPEGISNG